MKYRGIEMIQADNREDELSIGIQLTDLEQQNMDDVIDEVFDAVRPLGMQSTTYVEDVLDDYFLFRFNDIAFDETGVETLKKFYDAISEKVKDVKVQIDVHSHDWFVGKNGKEYNGDSVSFEEFMEHMEY